MATGTSRRKRTWSITTEGTTALARSAQHMDRVADARLAARPAAQCLAKYRYATRVERSAKLARGDLLVELIDVHGVRAIDIARRTGERPGDLSEMSGVCRTFPRDTRPGGAIYNHLLLATRVMRRFPQLALAPMDALAEIHRAGLSQHREVTRHFHQLAQSREMRLIDVEPSAPDDALINRCHHARFQDLLGRFADRSIQLLCVDPVYVFAQAGVYGARAARSLECDDADDAEAALATVIDLLRDWQPKLAVGGLVLLWQPWQPLLPEITTAAKRYGWEVEGPVIWDKKRTQPGRFDAPYSPQGEFLWLLHRPHERLLNHADDPSREMILRYAPVSSPGSAHEQLQGFEKPLALCEHLVRKHTRRGDLVVDACGCTGSMSVAARGQRRRWVYIESHGGNFATGSFRLAVEVVQGAATSGGKTRQRSHVFGTPCLGRAIGCSLRLREP